MKVQIKKFLDNWYAINVDGTRIEGADVFFTDTCWMCIKRGDGKIVASADIPYVKGEEKEAIKAIKPIVRHTLKGLGY